MDEEPRGIDYQALGYPDISYHGNQAWYVPKEKMPSLSGCDVLRRLLRAGTGDF